MQEHRKNKAINQCFLYSKFNNYTKVMSSAIMESERIDKDTQVFMEDVALELKRSKAPSYLLKVLTSKNTHLIYPKDPLPRSLRVFCAKDIKMGRISYNSSRKMAWIAEKTATTDGL